MALRIASDLTLPLEAVTETFAILAKRGVGKTYTASVFVEELVKAGLPVVVADPVGVWWGLRSSADGQHPGLPILVMGGDHGDVPLDVAAGSTVADLIVDERLSCVLDLSLFRKGEQVRFMTDFAERLYHRNREPLHLVLDEADAFAPQKPRPGTERLLGAIDDIVRRGRARGLGCTLITQRSAVINKDVLTQVEVLVALRTISPQDRAAIDEWVKVHGTPEQRAELMASLPSLPIGTAWFWSPAWLDVFQRVQVRQRETFDSSATPKIGAKPKRPKVLADVDLERIRERIAATIEKAKADDPKVLRARIAELERAAKSSVKTPADPPPRVETVIERVEVPVLTDDQVTELRFAIQRLADVGAGLMNTAEAIGNALARATKPAPSPRAQPPPVSVTKPPSSPSPRPSTPSDARVTGPQQRILNALASFEALGVRDVSRSNVAVFADASPSSSGYQNNLSALRTAGLLDYPASGRLCLTESGRTAAVPTTSIGSVAQLHDAWCAKLSGPQGRILRTLAYSYPNPLDREQLAEQVDASATSSGFQNNLSALRSLGLLDYPERGQVVATGLLFPEGVPA